MNVTIPTDLCDCDDEPRRGLTARKHMTMCRYGIIEEWESYRPATVERFGDAVMAAQAALPVPALDAEWRATLGTVAANLLRLEGDAAHLRMAVRAALGVVSASPERQNGRPNRDGSAVRLPS